jgi:hypothetical protein
MGWTIAANAAQPNVELSPAPLIAGIVSRLKERVPSKRLRYIALQELVRLRRELRAAVERRLLAAENAVAAALNESLQLGEADIEARIAELERQEGSLQGLVLELEAMITAQDASGFSR